MTLLTNTAASGNLKCCSSFTQNLHRVFPFCENCCYQSSSITDWFFFSIFFPAFLGQTNETFFLLKLVRVISFQKKSTIIDSRRANYLVFSKVEKKAPESSIKNSWHIGSLAKCLLVVFTTQRLIAVVYSMIKRRGKRSEYQFTREVISRCSGGVRKKVLGVNLKKRK